MLKANLINCTKGWFVGDFEDAVHRDVFEVAIKRYSAGESESRHVHKIARELTVVISGRIRMNGVEYAADDIVVIEPGESTDFQCLEDAVTCVVKNKSVKGDKYVI
jgi:mannose-6-phosphate isomerase-like protein (cupin superfamily)